MSYLYKLFDGEIGKVIEKRDETEEDHLICINGFKYEVTDDLDLDIDEWIELSVPTVNVNDIVLICSPDGYRGEGCYEGYYRNDDGEYLYLDIVNEYRVYRMELVIC